MKLKGIYIKGHAELGDISLSFSGGTESVSWATGLYGGTESGKSLALYTAASAFAGAASGSFRHHTVRADLVRVDFEVDNETVVVQSFGGRFERHGGISGKFDSNSNKNLLLYYNVDRLALEDRRGVLGHSLGVRSTVPILADIHLRGLSDSIVLIDDFDLGLSRSGCAEFFNHLRTHLRPKRNQLIIATRDKLDINIDWEDLGNNDVIGKSMLRLNDLNRELGPY